MNHDCPLFLDNITVVISLNFAFPFGNIFYKLYGWFNLFSDTNYQFEYRDLDMDLVECFLEIQEKWCQLKECLDKPDLFSEDYAVDEALTHFEELDYPGGAINQLFCSKAWAHMKYINREQDLGLEGLREVNKYTLIPKED